jgi:hypothetical protein
VGGSAARNGGLSADSTQRLKTIARQPSREEEDEMTEDDESLNDEDRMIAELEKKLGMDRRKSSKLGDEELDG